MGHAENYITQGVYGHEKDDDMDKAAEYMDRAFAELLGETWTAKEA